MSVSLPLTLARRKAPGTHEDQSGLEEADPSFLLATQQVAALGLCPGGPPEATSADHTASSWHPPSPGKAFQTLARISKPCPLAAWTHCLIPSASAPRPSLGLLPPPGPASPSLPPLHLQNAICLQSPAQRPPPPGSLRMPPSRWKHPRLPEDLSNLVPSTGWPRLEELPGKAPTRTPSSPADPPLQGREGPLGYGKPPARPLPPHRALPMALLGLAEISPSQTCQPPILTPP